MRLQVRSLALLGGLRIQHCRELWCRSQMRLRSCVAVAVVEAGSYNSNSPPCLGTTICPGCGPKKQEKNNNPFPSRNLNLRMDPTNPVPSSRCKKLNKIRKSLQHCGHQPGKEQYASPFMLLTFNNTHTVQAHLDENPVKKLCKIVLDRQKHLA